jgi:hypothetical protein
MMFRVVFWDILPCKMIVDNHFTRQYNPEDSSEHQLSIIYTNEFTVTLKIFCSYCARARVCIYAIVNLHYDAFYVQRQCICATLHTVVKDSNADIFISRAIDSSKVSVCVVTTECNTLCHETMIFQSLCNTVCCCL